ncbi:methyltransferase domain-containing protein [Acaryochloris marina S15]|nr:methyltransferase domain-containing protein [Acaryochloris marina S15]
MTSMGSQFRFSDVALSLLCCPVCKGHLELQDHHLSCQNPGCPSIFPVVNSAPILLNESTSIFSIAEFEEEEGTIVPPTGNGVKARISAALPNIDVNPVAKQNYKQFTQQLLQYSDHPKVLVIGCGNLGQGMEALVSQSNIELIESDIYFSERTQLICDAHDLPFADQSIDGVIIQAVLEHVVDPYRCVAEMHRVLKPNGLVYAETPFMQQVHMGRYDFTRFTHLGHRRLFRHFQEVESGPVGGPGMALAWSYQYFLLSFTKRKALRKLIKIFTRLTSFYLQYFDRYLVQQSGVFDAASGYYFIGKKDTVVLSDRELIKLYKGNI